jgi:hypothetical protein
MKGASAAVTVFPHAPMEQEQVTMGIITLKTPQKSSNTNDYRIMNMERHGIEKAIHHRRVMRGNAISASTD